MTAPCPDCEAWQASAEESREIRSELLAAIASLTGTALDPCACGGHLSADAYAQIKAAQAGWAAPGAPPWRPKVGEDCYVWHSGHWLRARRCEDGQFGSLVFWYAITGATFEFNIAPELLVIRPVGSLPAPESARAKMATATATPECEPSILVEPPGGAAR